MVHIKKTKQKKNFKKKVIFAGEISPPGIQPRETKCSLHMYRNAHCIDVFKSELLIFR